MQIAEVTGAQRDQMTVRAEVGLEVRDLAAVLADLEPQLFGRAGTQLTREGDGVSVDGGGPGRGRDGGRPVGAGDGEVRAQRQIAGVLGIAAGVKSAKRR